jgi:ornithine lipid hydroxylase
MIATISATYGAIATRRVDPELVAALGGLVSCIVCFGLERVIPFERDWQTHRDDLRSDMFFAALGAVVTPIVVRALFFSALVFAARALGGVFGRPQGLWPASLPLFAQVLFALLVSELGGYLAHRAQHRWWWLWPVHAIHHDAPRVYFFNGLRLHPGDTIVSVVTIMFPLVLLGAPADVLALVAAIGNAHVPMQHVNADLRFGWLEYVVSTPTLHRWHHSRVVAESESNYGGVLIVWDLLFGTYFAPADRRPPKDVGLYDGEEIGPALFAQLIWPADRVLRIAEEKLTRATRGAPSDRHEGDE